jgi:hypothetical protein
MARIAARGRQYSFCSHFHLPLNDSQGGAAVFAVVVEEHPDDVGSRADVGKVKLRITTESLAMFPEDR